MKKFTALVFALVACFSLIACGAKSMEETIKTLEKAGYSIQISDTAEGDDFLETAAGVESGSLLGEVIAHNGDNYVYVFFCSDADAAQKIYDFSLSLYNEADAEKVANDIIELDGNIVYLGTRQGIDDAK